MTICSTDDIGRGQIYRALHHKSILCFAYRDIPYLRLCIVCSMIVFLILSLCERSRGSECKVMGFLFYRNYRVMEWDCGKVV